jgi:hypothetical protein
VVVLLGAFAASEISQPRDGVEDKVDECHHDDDAEGVTPHADDGDNVRPATVRRGDLVAVWCAGEPAEGSEERSQDLRTGQNATASRCHTHIDTNDGANKLPRGPSASATSNEDTEQLSA